MDDFGVDWESVEASVDDEEPPEMDLLFNKVISLIG